TSAILADEVVIENLHYDPETGILSGKTAPYADIYLSDTAGRISADQNGHFQVSLPDTENIVTVTALDTLANASTEFDYALAKNTRVPEETSTTSNAAKETTNATTAKTEQGSADANPSGQT